MTNQLKFFYDHAGYSVAQGETNAQGRRRSARELANAESWAAQWGFEFVIEPDQDADESWMDNESEEYQKEWRGQAWWCQMLDADGNVVQSLGGCYGDSDYARVVKAELALEQLAEVELELKNKVECEKLVTC
jgi:hypothetical protein